MSSFLFISDDVVFQETTPKGALLEVTMLELNKVSNNPPYSILVYGISNHFDDRNSLVAIS